ncbi:vitellogenin [Salix suchowensis]|nr:vitellogenin [Salix suchowensis]
MCSETSPRISFSNGLGHDGEIEQVSRRDTKLLDSNSDFEFSICSSLGHESSPADEIFADGMILPVQIQERITPSKQVHGYESPRKGSLPPPLPFPSANNNFTEDSMRELLVVNSNRLEEKPQSKSFWGFKRCSSLNSDIKRSLCSIPLLLRSNSTGSEPNAKRTTLKDTRKNNSQKHQSASMAKSEPSSSSSSESSFIYSLPKKPPLKKGGSYGKISPVLSLPPPYIYKGTANLFGLGSFLRNGKEKKIRK